jgi:hypothetical protein
VTWVPKKADAARVKRAREAQALRAERRGKAAIKLEASRRAAEGIEAVRRELDQAPTQPDSGKRQ